MKRVLERLWQTRREGKTLHLSLLDPEEVLKRKERFERIVKSLDEAGTSAFLVGGSTGIGCKEMEEVIDLIKEYSDKPVIIFPGSVAQVTPKADAILFLSLLNSSNPYFIIGAQVQAAPLVLRYGLEVIPTAYIIVGYGGAAGYMGSAVPIPYEKPELVSLYSMTACLMGFKAVYLEAGSGAPKPVPEKGVAGSKKYCKDAFVIVGGGIRSKEQAERVLKAGADAIVTGTLLERDLEKAVDLVRFISNFRTS